LRFSLDPAPRRVRARQPPGAVPARPGRVGRPCRPALV